MKIASITNFQDPKAAIKKQLNFMQFLQLGPFQQTIFWFYTFFKCKAFRLLGIDRLPFLTNGVTVTVLL